MAIETKKIIEISTAGAVSSVKELKDEINSLRDAWLNAEEGSEEYEAITNQLIEDQKKLNDVMRIGKNEASAATGSYNSLVNQMSALKVAWRSTTSEVQRAQLGDKIREINDQLKAYDESIGNHQRKVGSYEQALQALTKTYDSQKQELAALKTALDNLEPGTDAYNQAFERAAELTHNLQERQEMLRMSANDLGTQLSNVANIGAGLVGGFNSINAIMTLTGQKNEDLQKTMVKLQAGIALVQGLKGIEGAIKSMKGYANWAAKVYDNIANMANGQKNLTKQIQSTTVATEANAAANNADAAAEAKATAGAAGLSVGMKGAKASIDATTTSAIALKAVLVSLGIGVIIAGISALVGAIANYASESSRANEKARDNAQMYIDLLNEWDKKQKEVHNREMDLMKAQGATDAEVYKAELDYHDQVLKQYDAEYYALMNVSSAITEYKEHVMEIPWKSGMGGKVSPNAGKKILEMAGLTPELYKEFGKEVRGDFEYTVQFLESRLAQFTDNLTVDFSSFGDNAVEVLKNIKENGIQTYQDLENAAKLYGAALMQYKEDYKFDPIGEIKNELKVKAAEVTEAAKNAGKTEIQVEKDTRDAELAIIDEAYNKRLISVNEWNSSRQAIERAHNKKIYDIITAATQSIIDNAKAANQKELQNLIDAQQKELNELAKYGQLKKKVTITDEKGITEVITAEEAVRRKYAKQTAEVILNNSISTAEAVIAKIRDEVHDARNYYDELTTAGVKDGETLKKAHTEAVDEAYKYTSSALTETLNQWEKIYKDIENDTNIDAKKRLEIWQKYMDAKAALEENETKHTLDQIKIRKDALAAEIEEIKKKHDADARANTKATARQDKDSATGWGGFWNTWAGNVQNPSFEQQQQNIEIKFQMDLDSLNEQYDAYQKVIDDMNVTDAERTAAMEQQAEIRNQIMDLSTQKAIDSANIQIDKQKELINTIVDVGSSISDILGSVADAWESNVQRQIKAGKMSEEEGEKEMEKIRALQIVQATINMLAGSFGAFAQASETIPPPYGQIVGGVAAAAVIAAGIAQIAAIRAAGENSSAGATSTMMGQVTPVMTDYQPQMTGILTGEQETEKLANAMSGVNLWVSVTDIDNAQEKGRVRVSESTF